MSSAADWYARKLGHAPQQPRPNTPPMGPAGYQQPVYQPPMQPAHPQYLPQSPQQVAPGPPTLTKENVIDVMLNRPDVWQGRGPSVKANEVHSCPQCGSPHFFTRAGKSSKVNSSGMRCAPAPLCDSCGYNGLWEQFGTSEPTE